MLYIKGDPLLDKAAFLAKKGDFENAIKILQDEESQYRNSLQFYQILGIICLHAGRYVEAYECLKIAKRIKPKNDKLILLGIAVFSLKNLNTVQAVDCYLDVLELEPKNKLAKNALDIIRKHSASETLADWVSSPARLSKLFPPIPAPFFNKRIIISAAIVITAVFLLVFGILILSKTIANPFKKQSDRPSAEYTLSAQERREPIETGGYYRYILTRDQAINLYDRALSLFTNYRDEAAKVSLNRIIESNASEGLKNRAHLLIENMEVPGFDNFKRADNPSYSDIKTEPIVYRNVHVIWRGMATNTEVTDDKTSFDLLVGYDTRRTLEGIVTVIFDRPVAINTERPLEVLGKIILTSSADFILEGVAIHQSGRLEE
ncbi:MAG: tetratricopeptide repeat protein [Treponema sp.]|nr:tetratricopeptide repeat protein [Treponema sp.]MCL2250287.1 tetratricopeptide repeat protein [Treponema sp.]